MDIVVTISAPDLNTTNFIGKIQKTRTHNREITTAASAPPKNAMPPEHVICHYSPNKWAERGTCTPLHPACAFLFHCLINGIHRARITCQKFNERYFSQSLAGTHKNDRSPGNAVSLGHIFFRNSNVSRCSDNMIRPCCPHIIWVVPG